MMLAYFFTFMQVIVLKIQISKGRGNATLRKRGEA